MTNLEVIEKLKEYQSDMAEFFHLKLKDDVDFFPFAFDHKFTHYTRIELSSDTMKPILHVKIFHDDDDPANCQIAQAALKIVETFTNSYIGK